MAVCVKDRIQGQESICHLALNVDSIFVSPKVLLQLPLLQHVLTAFMLPICFTTFSGYFFFFLYLLLFLVSLKMETWRKCSEGEIENWISLHFCIYFSKYYFEFVKWYFLYFQNCIFGFYICKNLIFLFWICKLKIFWFYNWKIVFFIVKKMLFLDFIFLKNCILHIFEFLICRNFTFLFYNRKIALLQIKIRILEFYILKNCIFNISVCRICIILPLEFIITKLYIL